MDDGEWIEGEFEGFYVGNLSDAGACSRLYIPNIVRAVIRSPKRTAGLLEAASLDEKDEDVDRRRRVPFRQDHIADAVIMVGDQAFHVALSDVVVFRWRVPSSAERDGRTLGRIYGTVIAKVDRGRAPVVAPTLPPAVPQSPLKPIAGPVERPGGHAPPPGGAVPPVASVPSVEVASSANTGGTGCGSLIGAALGLVVGLLYLLALPALAVSWLGTAWLGFSGTGCLAVPFVLALLYLLGRSRAGRTGLGQVGCGLILALFLLNAILSAFCASPPVISEWRQREEAQAARTAAGLANDEAVAAGGGQLVTVDDALNDPRAFFASSDHRIYLSTAALFEFNSDRLSSAASPELRKLARLLQEDPTRRVVLEGHADTIGDPDVNLDISGRRAGAVREWLIHEAGANPDQVATIGYGSTRPLVAPTGSAQEQGANRRVEVRPVVDGR